MELINAYSRLEICVVKGGGAGEGILSLSWVLIKFAIPNLSLTNILSEIFKTSVSNRLFGKKPFIFVRMCCGFIKVIYSRKMLAL